MTSDVLKENGPQKEMNGAVENELEKCQKEKEEYLDGWKRAKADLINYKKEEAKRFEGISRFSQEILIRDLINVLDSFDLALSALEKEGKAEKGVYLIRTQMEDILRGSGLERIIVSVGQPFDPALQEAIVAVESDKSPDTVVEEIERGYLLRGKLIRPARVKVAK
ncbi:MAG: nucleotide exchange factor GrpE [Patescibacteria group bacterium]